MHCSLSYLGLVILLLVIACAGFRSIQFFPAITHRFATEALLSPVADDEYWIRPFNSTTDLEQLQEICRTVFGGTDDLPSQAALYEELKVSMKQSWRSLI
jgi:hypothetical protein